MSYPTKEDWGKIHAKAWKDPEFYNLLQEDPKQALTQYGNEVGKSFTQVVKLDPRPEGLRDDQLETVHPYPPVSCC